MNKIRELLNLRIIKKIKFSGIIYLFIFNLLIGIFLIFGHIFYFGWEIFATIFLSLMLLPPILFFYGIFSVLLSFLKEQILLIYDVNLKKDNDFSIHYAIIFITILYVILIIKKPIFDGSLSSLFLIPVTYSIYIIPLIYYLYKESQNNNYT
jgi:hypothetical protein